MVARQKLSPLIVILGETASGKSAIALELAKKFNGEIINADSWSVYNGFDIGTAKPSLKEQQEIKHHLLDVADPKDGFSAAIFKRLAIEAIDNINKKGKIAILCGGTGLYIDSIIYDYSFLPPSSKQLRDKYNSMTLDEIKNEVKNQNIDTDGIDLGNKRRLIRLLENDGVRPASKEIRDNLILIGLKIDIDILTKNLESRVDLMFERGLENEVFKLSEKYGWDIESMKGIGYREFKPYFEGKQTIEETRKLIILHSLQLAKKQRTWFKRNNSIQWLSNREEIIVSVTTHLNKLNV